MSKGIGSLKDFLERGLDATSLSLESEISIDQIFYDTRLITFGGDGLFVDLAKDEKQSVTNLEQAYQKGVRNFILNDTFEHPTYLLKDSSILQSDSPLHTLQNIAKLHRLKLRQIPLIGITGSNGKTIIKEWLNQLLMEDFVIHRSPLSFNSQLGVAVSVLGLREYHTLSIIEAGISQSDEMERLEKMIQPDIGIFSMIGEAHQANFKDYEEKINEKIKLFKGCGKIIYHTKYNQIKIQLEKAKDEGLINKDCSLIEILNEDYDFIKDYITNQPLIENLQLCFGVIEYGLGKTSIEKYIPAIKQLNQLPLRLEILSGKNNCTIINDSYSADIQSLKMAIEVLNQQNQHPNKLIILGDFEEQNSTQLNQQIKEIIKDTPVIFIGNKIVGYDLTGANILGKFSSSKEVIDYLEKDPANDSAILIKGARHQHLEEIAKELMRQKHLTCLEINLSAMERNLKVYRSLLHPGTKIMVVVKALSYGSGSFEIANMLQHQKVDYISVAYSDEGAHLRANGITLPIMVMNPTNSTYPALIANKLEPEIYSISQLQSFIEVLKKESPTLPYPIHIKLDTGMNRLGFKEEDMASLLSLLSDEKDCISVRSIMSHLSSAEDENEDEFTNNQIKLFEKLNQGIVELLKYQPIRHILNSPGISRFTSSQMDMVRLGIGLHGIDPGMKLQTQLETATQWLTYISQIKSIKKGESIGYNRGFKADKDIKIAIIEVGYADGLRRSLSFGKFSASIHGKKAPIVGKICMDMSMLDVSRLDCKEGDEVVIFGKENPVQYLAECMETIPYEVLTSISARVKRVYIRE